MILVFTSDIEEYIESSFNILFSFMKNSKKSAGFAVLVMSIRKVLNQENNDINVKIVVYIFPLKILQCVKKISSFGLENG